MPSDLVQAGKHIFFVFFNHAAVTALLIVSASNPSMKPDASFFLSLLWKAAT